MSGNMFVSWVWASFQADIFLAGLTIVQLTQARSGLRHPDQRLPNPVNRHITTEHTTFMLLYVRLCCVMCCLCIELL